MARAFRTEDAKALYQEHDRLRKSLADIIVNAHSLQDSAEQSLLRALQAGRFESFFSDSVKAKAVSSVEPMADLLAELCRYIRAEKKLNAAKTLRMENGAIITRFTTDLQPALSSLT